MKVIKDSDALSLPDSWDQAFFPPLQYDSMKIRESWEQVFYSLPDSMGIYSLLNSLGIRESQGRVCHSLLDSMDIRESWVLVYHSLFDSAGIWELRDWAILSLTLVGNLGAEGSRYLFPTLQIFGSRGIKLFSLWLYRHSKVEGLSYSLFNFMGIWELRFHLFSPQLHGHSGVERWS